MDDIPDPCSQDCLRELPTIDGSGLSTQPSQGYLLIILTPPQPLPPALLHPGPHMKLEGLQFVLSCLFALGEVCLEGMHCLALEDQAVMVLGQGHQLHLMLPHRDNWSGVKGNRATLYMWVWS